MTIDLIIAAIACVGLLLIVIRAFFPPRVEKPSPENNWARSRESAGSAKEDQSWTFDGGSTFDHFDGGGGHL